MGFGDAGGAHIRRGFEALNPGLVAAGSACPCGLRLPPEARIPCAPISHALLIIDVLYINYHCYMLCNDCYIAY